MKHSRIKRIDEAQALLMQEAEENGLQFVLIVKAKDGTVGAVCRGKPLSLGTAMAYMTKECEPLRNTIIVAHKGLDFVKQQK